ncbi:MAG: ribosomal-processing cysteine protease Prp [Clostridia bacterium]|jgi:uncharacterized protein YsxB (DUF464 family)|nr:ribosomal-processing cysteine protease Prp [Clostridia bacterium]
MIKAKFFHSDGVPSGFQISGHAGYGISGEDIVCASVSSAAYMVANTITEVMGVAADITVNESGSMALKVPEANAHTTKDILLGFELHISELSKQYPKNVTITTTEV